MKQTMMTPISLAVMLAALLTGCSMQTQDEATSALPDSISEKSIAEAVLPETDLPTDAERPAVHNPIYKDYYADILSATEFQMPNGETVNEGMIDEYALVDMNQDGLKELLTVYNGGHGQVSLVYLVYKIDGEHAVFDGGFSGHYTTGVGRADNGNGVVFNTFATGMYTVERYTLGNQVETIMTYQDGDDDFEIKDRASNTYAIYDLEWFNADDLSALD